MLIWLCGMLICGVFFLHRLWKEYGVLLQSLPLGTKELSYWTVDDIDTENAESSSDDTYSTAIIGGTGSPTSIFLAENLGSETETETEK